MMYQIAYNGEFIYGSDENKTVLNPNLEVELNSAGTLTLTIPVENEAWNNFEVFRGEVEVYEGDDIIWFGRPLQIVRDWMNRKVVTCEGALAYFNDSLQVTKEYKQAQTPLYTDATVYPGKTGFINDIIGLHNDQVESDRKIYIGEIDVDNELVYRYVDYETTADILQRMCLDTNGGYFIIRKALDEVSGQIKRYLDWRKEMPYSTDQPIQFGLNLLDLNQDLNGADICTVLLPTGENDLNISTVQVYSEDDPNHPPYHINDPEGDVLHGSGSVYMTHLQGYKRFGRVVKTKDFNNIADKNSLFQKAAEWLNEQNVDVTTIECSAADLHYLNEYSDYGKLRIGQLVQVGSTPHDLSKELPIYKISMKLDSGAKTITMGTPPKRELTDIVKSNGGSTRGSSGATGSGSASDGGSGGSTYVPVTDVKVKMPGENTFGTVVQKRIAKIDLSGLDLDYVKDVKFNDVGLKDSNKMVNVESGDNIKFTKLGDKIIIEGEGGLTPYFDVKFIDDRDVASVPGKYIVDDAGSYIVESDGNVNLYNRPSIGDELNYRTSKKASVVCVKNMNIGKITLQDQINERTTDTTINCETEPYAGIGNMTIARCYLEDDGVISTYNTGVVVDFDLYTYNDETHQYEIEDYKEKFVYSYTDPSDNYVKDVYIVIIDKCAKESYSKNKKYIFSSHKTDLPSDCYMVCDIYSIECPLPILNDYASYKELDVLEEKILDELPVKDIKMDGESIISDQIADFHKYPHPDIEVVYKFDSFDGNSGDDNYYFLYNPGSYIVVGFMQGGGPSFDVYEPKTSDNLTLISPDLNSGDWDRSNDENYTYWSTNKIYRDIKAGSLLKIHNSGTTKVQILVLRLCNTYVTSIRTHQVVYDPPHLEHSPAIISGGLRYSDEGEIFISSVMNIGEVARRSAVELNNEVEHTTRPNYTPINSLYTLNKNEYDHFEYDDYVPYVNTDRRMQVLADFGVFDKVTQHFSSGSDNRRCIRESISMPEDGDTGDFYMGVSVGFIVPTFSHVATSNELNDVASDLSNAINAKQDPLSAGINIDINSNKIHANKPYASIVKYNAWRSRPDTPVMEQTETRTYDIKKGGSYLFVINYKRGLKAVTNPLYVKAYDRSNNEITPDLERSRFSEHAGQIILYFRSLESGYRLVSTAEIYSHYTYVYSLIRLLNMDIITEFHDVQSNFADSDSPSLTGEKYYDKGCFTLMISNATSNRVMSPKSSIIDRPEVVYTHNYLDSEEVSYTTVYEDITYFFKWGIYDPATDTLDGAYARYIEYSNPDSETLDFLFLNMLYRIPDSGLVFNEIKDVQLDGTSIVNEYGIVNLETSDIVEANSSESPTSMLEVLKVNDAVYSVYNKKDPVIKPIFYRNENPHKDDIPASARPDYMNVEYPQWRSTYTIVEEGMYMVVFSCYIDTVNDPTATLDNVSVYVDDIFQPTGKKISVSQNSIYWLISNIEADQQIVFSYDGNLVYAVKAIYKIENLDYNNIFFRRAHDTSEIAPTGDGSKYTGGSLYTCYTNYISGDINKDTAYPGGSVESSNRRYLLVSSCLGSLKIGSQTGNATEPCINTGGFPFEWPDEYDSTNHCWIKPNKRFLAYSGGSVHNGSQNSLLSIGTEYERTYQYILHHDNSMANINLCGDYASFCEFYISDGYDSIDGDPVDYQLTGKVLNKMRIGPDIYTIPSGGSNVVPNPSGSALGDLVSISIDGDVYDIPSASGSVVIPNPQSGTPSGDLNTISIDGAKYTIPQGINVVANPSGTATGELTKLQVGNDIYGTVSPTELSDAVTTLQTNFQAGVDAIYNACVAKGSTPESHSLSDVVDGIMAITTETPIYELATPAMTSNTTPSGVCSASEIYSSPKYEPWYAFSGTLGGDAQSWCTRSQTTGAWIQYEFPTAVMITKIATTNRNLSTPRACNMFKFQGSNDGVTYVDLGDEYTITSSAKSYRQEFYIPNQTAYTHYRIYVTAAYSSERVGFGQIELYKSTTVAGKVITQNGLYNAADDGFDGYNAVLVKVSKGEGDVIDFSSEVGAAQLDEVSATVTLDLSDFTLISEAGGV